MLMIGTFKYYLQLNFITHVSVKTNKSKQSHFIYLLIKEIINNTSQLRSKFTVKNRFCWENHPPPTREEEKK